MQPRCVKVALLQSVGAKRQLGVRIHALRHEIGDLGHDELRHDEGLPRVIVQERRALLVMSVVSICGRIQRVSVNDDRHR
jgi:hypothetical protein